MSMESSTWLNQMTLIGQTDKRGTAWHYRAADQGAEPNHYPGFVPVADVKRRLFHWVPQEGKVSASVMTDDGVFTVIDPDRKAIVRPAGTFGPDDRGGILGIFKDGYTVHDYEEWLVRQVELLLDDDLGITSAGLLRMGAQAWVEVSVPETFTTPSGVTFRPNILAATSLDGSLATTYGRTITNTVCDNTMAAAIGEMGAMKTKVKHSRYSKLKLAEAKEALALVHTMADDFTAEVERLTNTTVTDDQWRRFLDGLAPLKDEKGEEKTGRALTLAQGKRDTLTSLWNWDNRVLPWKNTAWGVVQAVNTATHHEFHVRGADRAERNMAKAIAGDFERLDRETLATLEAALA